MKKDVLVPVAQGSEELEMITIVDVLRRAGAYVTIASIDIPHIVASKGVKIIADTILTECIHTRYDLIVLPGGMPGSERLRDSNELIEMLRNQKKAGRWYGAICAAPAVVLDYHGLIDGYNTACHPDFRYLIKHAVISDEVVVVDRNLITGRGAGAAVPFGLKLVELLFDSEKAHDVAKGMALV